AATRPAPAALGLMLVEREPVGEAGGMWWSRGQVPPSVLQSEHGFLAIAGREKSLTPQEAVVAFRDLVSADMAWTDDRKRRNRRKAKGTQVAGLILTALSTVVLGIPTIPEQAAIALPMVATVTVLAGLETFNSWRALWVLMEETQYRLHRVRDHMDFYLVTTPADQVSLDRLREFFDQQQEIWNDVSRRWLEFRKLDRTPREVHSAPGEAR
ncbi:MAG TPA: SLATT domain-containing protein, partial [Actinophytocola sp.]|uniref:SLATT domain-containing protein n=1 Tax=Actinophytocola sp. TaxID=1872138 RepID=UPI002DBF8A5C